MHTVASARTWAFGELKRAHVESPALTADLILGFVLGWDRVRILSHGERTVPNEKLAAFRDLVGRRVKGEPLQYLTGEKEFYGLVFHVTHDVLIPRPETELLVEKAIELVNCMPPNARFLDVGTGSGCIAISVAHEAPSSAGCAVDISDRALRIAGENAKRHGVEERILLIQSDLIECFPQSPCFDLILCNPPYVPLEDYDSLPHEVRAYEPPEALLGGESGLEIYRRLIPDVPSRLTPVTACDRRAKLVEMAKQLVEKAGLRLEIIMDDLQRIPRCLVGQKLLRRNRNNG